MHQSRYQPDVRLHYNLSLHPCLQYSEYFKAQLFDIFIFILFTFGTNCTKIMLRINSALQWSVQIQSLFNDTTLYGQNNTVLNSLVNVHQGALQSAFEAVVGLSQVMEIDGCFQLGGLLGPQHWVSNTDFHCIA